MTSSMPSASFSTGTTVTTSDDAATAATAVDQSKTPANEEGCYLVPLNYDQSQLSYYTDNDKIIPTFNHSRKFFFKSDEFIGELKLYESKILNSGPCLYVKKSKNLELFKTKLAKTFEKKVKFYGKSENSSLLGCYVDVVRNMEDEICVNAVVNGQPVLLNVQQLYGKVGKLTCVLRSGVIKKVNEDLFWSLNVTEIKLDDASPDEYNYFKRSEPIIKFLG